MAHLAPGRGATTASHHGEQMATSNASERERERCACPDVTTTGSSR